MRKLEIQQPQVLYSGIKIIENNECIAEVWTDIEDAELLAAAPELLEELKKAVAIIEAIPYAGVAVKEARELISRLEV